MKEDRNNWIDDNNNTWSKSIYTKAQAEKFSNTLTDCYNCHNCSGCSYCRDCTGCSGCSGCSYCRDCTGCSYCSYCSGCSGCRGCRGCIDCIDCSGCSGCIDCSYCNDCRSCSDFKSNPQRITSNNIGSRKSQTTFYWNDEHEQIVCGCFKGTMSEFKEKITEVHKDNQHAQDYFKWIEAVEAYREAITPKPAND